MNYFGVLVPRGAPSGSDGFHLAGAHLAGTRSSHCADSSPACPHAGFQKGHFGMGSVPK